MEDIESINPKGDHHGYQEWYYLENNHKLYLRGDMKNGNEIGYEEWHSVKRTNFYIR
jgi:hypothetical protein